MPNRFVENLRNLDGMITVAEVHHTPYYIPDNTKPQSGAVRTNQGGLEYYDTESHAWYPLPGSSYDIEAGPMLENVINWAYKKMEEERRIEKLCEEYPSLKLAKDNYELVKTMVMKEDV